MTGCGVAPEKISRYFAEWTRTMKKDKPSLLERRRIRAAVTKPPGSVTIQTLKSAGIEDRLIPYFGLQVAADGLIYGLSSCICCRLDSRTQRWGYCGHLPIPDDPEPPFCIRSTLAFRPGASFASP